MFGFKVTAATLLGAVVVVAVTYFRGDVPVASKEFKFTAGPDFGLREAMAEIRADLSQFARSENARALRDAFQTAASGEAILPLTPPEIPGPPQ